MLFTPKDTFLLGSQVIPFSRWGRNDVSGRRTNTRRKRTQGSSDSIDNDLGTPVPHARWVRTAESFQSDVEYLRRNNRVALNALAPIIDEPFKQIEMVSPVYLPTVENPEGVPFGMEIRFEPSNKRDAKDKFFRFIYTCGYVGVPNLPDQKGVLCTQFKILIARGQYIPPNAPELVRTVNAFVDGSTDRLPVVLWTEGEKARTGLDGNGGLLALVRRCQAIADARHIAIVTSSYISGMPGAQGINFSLIPKDPEVIEAAKNEGVTYIELDLKKALHIIVRDNDKQGLHEAWEVGTRLIEEYGVPSDQVKLAQPPAGLGRNDGRDDADPLPDGVSEEARLDQILHSKNLVDIVGYRDWRTDRERYQRAEAMELQFSRNRVPYDNLYNVTAVLAHNEVLFDAFSYDLLRHRVIEKKPIPNIAGSCDDEELFPKVIDWETTISSVLYQVQKIAIPTASKHVVGDAIMTRAKVFSFHPIKDRLEALQWDGVDRNSTFFHVVYGTPNDDYHMYAGRIFPRSLVARIYRPGCKSELLYTLIGGEGLKKSSSCEFMAGGPDFFSNSLPAIHMHWKDAVAHCAKRVIVEIAEFVAFARATPEQQREFLSMSYADIRPPYGRGEIRVDRQNIFIATVNETDYSVRPGRRDVPIQVKLVNMGWLMEHWDQCLAQAVSEFKAGAPWWYEGEKEVELFRIHQRFVRKKDFGLEDHIEVKLRQIKADQAAGVFHYKDGFVFSDISNDLYAVNYLSRSEATDKRILKALKDLGCKTVLKDDGSPVRTSRGQLWRLPETLAEADDVPNGKET